MDNNLASIRDQIIRLDAKLDARFDSFQQLYVPRKELQVIHNNSDKARNDLADQVDHMDKEMAEMKKQMSIFTTTIRNYAVIAGFILAVVQTILTTILLEYFV